MGTNLRLTKAGLVCALALATGCPSRTTPRTRGEIDVTDLAAASLSAGPLYATAAVVSGSGQLSYGVFRADAPDGTWSPLSPPFPSPSTVWAVRVDPLVPGRV